MHTKNWIRQERVPLEQLPDELQKLADPAAPLSTSVQAAYEPPPHAKLNMARMILWFTFSIGALGVAFSLIINREKLSFYGIVLALCVVGLVWVYGEYAKHTRAGGDRLRRGTFVLPEGLLTISADKEGKRWASFLPRSEVTGFIFADAAEEYDHTVIRVETDQGEWTGCTFPSVGMLHFWHRQQLEAWQEKGDFRWEDYKRPKISDPGA